MIETGQDVCTICIAMALQLVEWPLRCSRSWQLRHIAYRKIPRATYHVYCTLVMANCLLQAVAGVGQQRCP